MMRTTILSDRSPRNFPLHNIYLHHRLHTSKAQQISSYIQKDSTSSSSSAMAHFIIWAMMFIFTVFVSIFFIVLPVVRHEEITRQFSS
eukprot:scaffold3834_cov179-Ochromonas_danica.AAC.11